MALLTFKTEKDIPSSFDQLVKNLFTDEVRTKATENAPSVNPLVNVLERNENFEIQLALPGWIQKEIQLSVDNEVLIITGEKKADKKSDHFFHRNEIKTGRFEKRFGLPEDSDGNIMAELKNGVLRILISKKSKADRKREIQVL